MDEPLTERTIAVATSCPSIGSMAKSSFLCVQACILSCLRSSLYGTAPWFSRNHAEKGIQLHDGRECAVELESLTVVPALPQPPALCCRMPASVTGSGPDNSAHALHLSPFRSSPLRPGRHAG
jgi:hypothetical protein